MVDTVRRRIMIVTAFFLMMYLSFIVLSVSSENPRPARDSSSEPGHSYLLVTNSSDSELPPAEIAKKVYLGEWARLYDKKVEIK